MTPDRRVTHAFFETTEVWAERDRLFTARTGDFNPIEREFVCQMYLLDAFAHQQTEAHQAILDIQLGKYRDGGFTLQWGSPNPKL